MGELHKVEINELSYFEIYKYLFYCINNYFYSNYVRNFDRKTLLQTTIRGFSLLVF